MIMTIIPLLKLSILEALFSVSTTRTCSSMFQVPVGHLSVTTGHQSDRRRLLSGISSSGSKR